MTKLAYSLLTWSALVIAGIFLVGFVTGLVGSLSRYQLPAAKTLSASDLVYFRDDVNMHCYAYLREHPESLVIVHCELVRW